MCGPPAISGGNSPEAIKQCLYSFSRYHIFSCIAGDNLGLISTCCQGSTSEVGAEFAFSAFFSKNCLTLVSETCIFMAESLSICSQGIFLSAGESGTCSWCQFKSTFKEIMSERLNKATHFRGMSPLTPFCPRLHSNGPILRPDELTKVNSPNCPRSAWPPHTSATRIRDFEKLDVVSRPKGSATILWLQQVSSATTPTIVSSPTKNLTLALRIGLKSEMVEKTTFLSTSESTTLFFRFFRKVSSQSSVIKSEGSSR